LKIKIVFLFLGNIFINRKLNVLSKATHASVTTG